MNVFNRKLWRTILSTKGQFLAVVAVITIGICIYISMSTAYYNLSRSRDLFYKESNFAGYYFHVVRAPMQVTRQIETIPGVIKATGRIQKDVPVIKDDQQRATARLISYPLPMENEVNRLRLLQGRLFEKYPQSGGIEILTDPKYAEANRLSFNSIVNIVAEGKQVPLTVVGAATSPEFIYNIKDSATMAPDPRTFGIIMLSQNQAEQVLNMPGQINQVVVSLAPGADEKKVTAQVKAILEPYGNLGNYPRKDQLSHALLQGELDQLRSASIFMPAIFLMVAAAIQFIMLGRMIKAQRLPIGVMKALGYNNRQIMLQYTGYSLAAAVSGALLGSLTGILLASFLSRVYSYFFNLPGAIGGVNFKAIVYGFAISVGISLFAGLSASRGVVIVHPAEAVRPEPPRGTGKIILERWAWLWRRLDATWKMSLRIIFRKWGRSGVTLMGVVFAVGLMVMALFFIDTTDYMIEWHFHKEQRYNYLVRLNVPVKEDELLNLARLEGVTGIEPLLEIPVKVHFNGRSEDDVLQGLPLTLTLKELNSEDGKPASLPQDGILINQRTASKLGAKAGDKVEIETLLGLGPSRRAVLKIAGVSRQLVGSGTYISLDQANRILQESGIVSGAMFMADPGKKGLIEGKLNEMTNVSSISSTQKELDNLNQIMDSMLYTVNVLIIFALLLGFAIVYNSSVISFAERKRELASLRVLGFSVREISGLLLKENFLQSLLGVTLGLPFGCFLSEFYTKSAVTDLYTLPIVFTPRTYLISALGGVVFVTVAHLLSVKWVKQLDLVDVLKNKD